LEELARQHILDRRINVAGVWVILHKRKKTETGCYGDVLPSAVKAKVTMGL
jgi:hypothetical protein